MREAEASLRRAGPFPRRAAGPPKSPNPLRRLAHLSPCCSACISAGIDDCWITLSCVLNLHLSCIIRCLFEKQQQQRSGRRRRPSPLCCSPFALFARSSPLPPPGRSGCSDLAAAAATGWPQPSPAAPTGAAAARPPREAAVCGAAGALLGGSLGRPTCHNPGASPARTLRRAPSLAWPPCRRPHRRRACRAGVERAHAAAPRAGRRAPLSPPSSRGAPSSG